MRKTKCDQCDSTTINGIYCHETGCPVAWKDYDRSCFECGCNFRPEERHQSVCEDCLNPVDIEDEQA